MFRLETTKSFMHIVFQVQINCFRDLFGRFTLVCSFFDNITEGPDSFYTTVCLPHLLINK